ncbi:unnamed protein product [Gulo gulo]|uniref:G-protein coupled receptors family 1 profile domain-containing protein n=1 Tax=Gulo gulo TaxID=48420 RepID=A0A9X9LI90_GULGU|nr:unnamed protein product [Gulo gulo]
MPSFNQSIFHPAVFFLTGIPGFETYHAWLSIPFCCLYAIAISGNGMILFVILTESSLHEPMYYFLSMLSFMDLGLCLSTLVTVLCIFWFNAREIGFDACVGQMFFIHGFTFMESSVLLAMAFDRFIAICNPLRYATILTSSRIIKVGFAIVIRGTTALVPLLLLLKRLSFCRKERKKAFGTCVSHISAVAIFYIPMISLSLVHRFGKHAPPLVHTLIANVYLLIPPVMNPIIYSVKTKQIRKAMLKIFSSKFI